MASERDKANMRRLARDLAAGESNERGSAEQREAVLRYVNHGRRADEMPPLTDSAPEEGFYERARSLGMARIDR